MTSFLDKLNVKLNGKAHGGSERRIERLVADKGAEAAAKPKEEELSQSQQLGIDVYEGPNDIVIYAFAPGVDPAAFDLTLDEENDVLVIRGSRKRSETERQADEIKNGTGRYIQEECKWEPFYRKIVLPHEVDVVKAEAVFRKGVLMVTLPILRVAEGRKLVVVEKLSEAELKPKAA